MRSVVQDVMEMQRGCHVAAALYDLQPSFLAAGLSFPTT
jgi:hypothetical protein